MAGNTTELRERLAGVDVRDRIPVYRRLSGDQRFAYRLLLLPILMMFVVHVIPIVWGTVISFMGVDSTYISRWYDAPFVQVDNFRYVLGIETFDNPLVADTVIGERFRFAIRQTIIFAVGTLVLTYGLGLGAALLLNREFKGRFLARTLLLLPWMAPAVVTLYIWRMMFQQQSGIINYLLNSIGIIDGPIYWLIGDNAIYSLIIAHSWTQFPLVMIFLYAGLQSIPRQLYEAAAIDGAGRWGKFRHVTLPQLKPVSAVIVLLTMLWTMINFTAPYILLGASPPRSGQVAILYIYNYAFGNYQFGRGAAMSVILFVIAMGLALVYYRYLFDDGTEGAA